MERVVIALGGNALGATAEEQRAAITKASAPLVGLIAHGYEIIVTHGNGPQVGTIAKAFEVAHGVGGDVPAMPMPECSAMSQGYIGYHLQQGLLAELRAQGMPWYVATVITQTRVDADDPAFANPTKPVGAFYDEATARAMMAAEPGLVMRPDAGRGWRRVVASPHPEEIIERESILNLLDHEFVVIACGGGGIPVVKGADGALHGVPAVIDKDFTAGVLADAVGAQYLFILTAVDKVSLDFGTPEQVDLDELDVRTAERYAAEGQFGSGSMLPKVMAAVEYVRGAPGREAVICSLARAPEAMAGNSGTRIHN
jgi:carbamate kinase